MYHATSPTKPKLFPIQPRSPVLARWMQSCLFILAVNWCLQGMRGMDRKELSFRLLSEAGCALLLTLAGGMAGLSLPWSLGPAVLVAHSLSFTLNGQLWVCVRYCRFYRRDPAALERFLHGVATELSRLPWLDEAVCIGSRGDRGLVRDERSDLDLRLVFPPGWRNWHRVNLLLLKLRTRAFLAAIPLDLYAYDQPSSLRRFDQRERLLVLLDRYGWLQVLFPERVTPWPT